MGATEYRYGFVVPCGILLAISVPVLAARLYSRIRPRNILGPDDYIITLAQAIIITWYSLNVTLFYHGRGEGIVGSSTPEEAYFKGPRLWTVGLFYLWGANLVRISMGLMLLRLKETRIWKLVLWSLIGFQVCWMIAVLHVQLLVCHPVAASLGLPTDEEPVCLGADAMITYGYIYTASNIFCDFFYSCMPLTFLRRIHRRRLERFLIGFLFMTGLVATAAAIAKMVIVIQGLEHHAMEEMELQTDLLCGVELILGVTAASLPMLKPQVQRWLHNLGFFSRRSDGSGGGGGGSGTRSLDSFLETLVHGRGFMRQIRELSLEDVEAARGDGAEGKAKGSTASSTSGATTGDEGRSVTTPTAPSPTLARDQVLPR